MFVYLITNTINGMRYIGQTKQSLADRFIAHTHKNHCHYLYNAIKKYGKENFIIEAIVEVPTKELANEFEIEYIEKYCTLAPNGYNICLGGDDRTQCFSGRRHSEESKLKMRLAKLGTIQSEETKKKKSEALAGKKKTEETRQNMVNAWKIREKPFGNKRALGHKVSEEARKKMSEARKKYWEQRNISE